MNTCEQHIADLGAAADAVQQRYNLLSLTASLLAHLRTHLPNNPGPTRVGNGRHYRQMRLEWLGLRHALHVTIDHDCTVRIMPAPNHKPDGPVEDLTYSYPYDKGAIVDLISKLSDDHALDT